MGFTLSWNGCSCGFRKLCFLKSASSFYVILGNAVFTQGFLPGPFPWWNWAQPRMKLIPHSGFYYELLYFELIWFNWLLNIFIVKNLREVERTVDTHPCLPPGLNNWCVVPFASTGYFLKHFKEKLALWHFIPKSFRMSSLKNNILLHLLHSIITPDKMTGTLTSPSTSPSSNFLSYPPNAFYSWCVQWFSYWRSVQWHVSQSIAFGSGSGSPGAGCLWGYNAHGAACQMKRATHMSRVIIVSLMPLKKRQGTSTAEGTGKWDSTVNPCHTSPRESRGGRS